MNDFQRFFALRLFGV